MSFSKKSLLTLILLGAITITGCQTQSNQTITFVTPAPTSVFNTHNQNAIVNVITQDRRPSAEVSKYTSSGNVQRLTAVPEVSALFQQAMQQNLNSKGFHVVQGAGNANVIINIHKFFANVEQGNLRYKVTANIGIEIQVIGTNGQFTKNFNTTRSYEGAFGADPQNIRNILNQAYTEIIHSIYNDNEIGNAIHQYK